MKPENCQQLMAKNSHLKFNLSNEIVLKNIYEKVTLIIQKELQFQQPSGLKIAH